MRILICIIIIILILIYFENINTSEYFKNKNNNNKNILLIGGTHGIGKIIYDDFKNNYNIITIGRTKLNNDNHIIYDLSESPHTLIDIINKKNIKFDIVIDNYYDFSNNTFEYQLNTNLKNNIIILEELIPYINSNGKIIIVSSGASNILNHINNNITIYSFIKSSLETFSKLLSNKYYSKEIGITVLKIDNFYANYYDPELIQKFNIVKRDPKELIKCWNYLFDTKWSELTGRIYNSTKIINDEIGYNLDLNYETIMKNNNVIEIMEKSDKISYISNINEMILNDNNYTNFMNYNIIYNELEIELSKKYNVFSDNIVLHNGTLLFLSKIIPLFVKKNHDIISADNHWRFMDYVVYDVNISYGYILYENKMAKPNYKEIITKINSLTRLIYLIGPLDATEFDNFLLQIPSNIIIVIDLCYDNYYDKIYRMNVKKYMKYNIIFINTFSKLYGLPGLNLSFSISNLKLAKLINYLFPYKINKSVQTVALQILKNKDYQKQVRDYYKNEINDIISILNKKNIEYYVDIPINIIIIIPKLNGTLPNNIKIINMNNNLITLRIIIGLPEVNKEIKNYLNQL